MWGSTSHAIPSRFLSELPEDLVEDVGLSFGGRADPRRAPSTWARRQAARAGHPRPSFDGDESGGEHADPFAEAHRGEPAGPAGVGDDWHDPDDDWHDPDPWHDEPPPTARPADGGRRRAPSRPSRRLPKMAERKFGLH